MAKRWTKVTRALTVEKFGSRAAQSLEREREKTFYAT